MATDQTTTEKSRNNGQQRGKQPRVISNPNDVADGTEARAARQGCRDSGFAGL